MKRDEDHRPFVEPADEIGALFAVGPDHRLRNALGWFEDFQGWRLSVST